MSSPPRRGLRIVSTTRKEVDVKTLSVNIPKLIDSLPKEKRIEMWGKAIRMIRGEKKSA